MSHLREIALACLTAIACGDVSPAGPDGGAADGDDDEPRQDQLCRDGWCWEFPGPQGSDLYATWGFGPSDLWAAGDDATVIHWDGTRWSYDGPLLPGDTDDPFIGMWASGPDDLWLWGAAGLWRRDAAGWTAMDPDPDGARRVVALTGDGEGAIIAVGEQGLVARWDGSDWTASTVGAGPLSSVWAAGDQIWAAGPVPGDNLEDVDTALWHAVGASWTSEIRQEGIAGFWGVAADDVYAYGAGFRHWDGESWSELDLPLAAGTMWGTSASDVWAFDWDTSRALHFDGDAWREADLPDLWIAYAASGTGPDQAWMVGAHGRIARWDGGAWTPIGGAPVGSESTWPGPGLWGTRGDDLWAAGAAGGVVRWDGDAWSATEVTGYYASVWGAGDAVWAAGAYGVRAFLHDASWDVTAPGGPPHFYGVWASSPTDAWAVGDAIHHHDGRGWTEVRDLSGLGVAMRAVWGRAADDVWAVGDLGTVLHWNGSSWQTSPTGTTDDFGAVWGSGARDVWAAGSRYDDGGAFHIEILRWDGEAWITFAAPSDEGIADALWGSAPDDVWLSARHTGSYGGLYSRLYHWDGAAWSEQHPPVRRYFDALRGWGAGRLAITTGGGLLRHRP